MGDLWSENTYNPPYNYLFDGNIQEYDISKANINILKAYNAISDEQYNALYISEKQIREKVVGNMQRSNKELIHIIKNGIIESKHQFFISNDIKDSEVVRIANDSVYVNRFIPIQNNVISLNGYNIVFSLKNVFRSMIRLHKILIFTGTDANNNAIVDIKGINKDNHYLHNSFCSFIYNIISLIERSTKNDVLDYYHKFLNSYMNYELPIDYYREFKPTSTFRIRGYNIGAMFLTEEYKSKLDIQWNLMLLRELYGIILNYYK